MREIKFRVWSAFRQKYVNELGEFALVLTLDGEIRNNEYGDLISLPYENFILEQYTGLKDKNGVEIYEGDRVRCADVYLDKDGNAIWNEMVIETIFDIYDLQPYVFEVIGNIHEGVKE